MTNRPRFTRSTRSQALTVGAVAVFALALGTAAVVAASDGNDGDRPIPVEPDGGIGDTPIPVEPDGGIGDTPVDAVDVDQALADARSLLDRPEAELPDDVRVGRRGDESFALTEDYVLGRMTVDLDDSGNGFRVTSVVVELPDGPQVLVTDAD